MDISPKKNIWAYNIKRSIRWEKNFWKKLIFKGTLPGYHFQDVFRIFLASADAYAPQNLCVGFILNAEQDYIKKFFKIPKFPIISELGLSPAICKNNNIFTF